jgi:hypothetical protein
MIRSTFGDDLQAKRDEALKQNHGFTLLVGVFLGEAFSNMMSTRNLIEIAVCFVVAALFISYARQRSMKLLSCAFILRLVPLTGIVDVDGWLPALSSAGKVCLDIVLMSILFVLLVRAMGGFVNNKGKPQTKEVRDGF